MTESESIIATRDKKREQVTFERQGKPRVVLFGEPARRAWEVLCSLFERKQT